ncbi:MAG TPA: addiction module protein [Kofleriaceae bacterium]|jgi:putative addiction module component (TIGR02574 family)|nr:addiction module protein [Kofleriaceae bacterium]
MASTDDLLKLDVQDRLKLIDKLWESVLDDLNDPASPQSLPVSHDLRRALDRRMAAYRANPDAGSSWPEVRARILKRR